MKITRRAGLRAFAAAAISACLPFEHFAYARRPAEPKFTPPPSDLEPPEIKALIDEAAAKLTAKKLTTTEVLTDANYMPAHEWPRFRKVIHEHPADGDITIVTANEPGERMRLRGTIRDDRGRIVKGAAVYLYQTSAEGWYSDRAPHYATDSGDRNHARLFGWVLTDALGQFKLTTVRPGGYPHSDLPAHIHMEILPADDSLKPLVTEILFEDDPRLEKEAARRRAIADQFIICSVNHGGDGVQYVNAAISLIATK